MLENAMAARGRPAKILTSNDLMTLQQFLEKLPFLKKNQQQALTLLQQANGIFNDKQHANATTQQAGDAARTGAQSAARANARSHRHCLGCPLRLGKSR